MSRNIRENVVGLLQDSRVWFGDFKVYSLLWGSNNNDSNGLIIEEFIDDRVFECINKVKGTLYNNIYNPKSVLKMYQKM